jgi:hypothetical protein
MGVYVSDAGLLLVMVAVRGCSVLLIGNVIAMRRVERALDLVVGAVGALARRVRDGVLDTWKMGTWITCGC